MASSCSTYIESKSGGSTYSRIVGIMLKFPSLFYSEFLSKSLHYAQLYSSPITIPYLQFKIPIKVSYRSILCHLRYSFHFHLFLLNAFIVCPEPSMGNLFAFFLTLCIFYIFYIIFKIFYIIYVHRLFSIILYLFPIISRIPYHFIKIS